jgi:hypothetical protein
MRVNRGLIFWGLALVVAGAVALLVQSGSIGEEAARSAWRFWPVALIIAGIAVIAARTPFALVVTVAAAIVVGGLAGTLVAGWPEGIGLGCGGEPTEQLSEGGSFDDDAADVDLRFNCGDLDVSMASGTGWTVDARFGADGRPEIRSTADAMSVVADDGGPIGFTNSRQEWRVELPSDPELALDLEANAASARLDLAGGRFGGLGIDANAGDFAVDLSGASVDGFQLDMNAGSADVIADGETGLTGSVGVNAGSLDLCVADGVAVEITLDDPNVTFSHNLEDHGFDESGDTWRLGSGTPTVRLDVEGNAASFTFNPDGGCE